MAVRRMCASGVWKRMISDTIDGISAGLARSLSYSFGNLLSATTHRDRVSRRVIAADDQQHEGAKEVHGILVHVLRRRPTRQQRNEIKSGLSVFTRSFQSRVKSSGTPSGLPCTSIGIEVVPQPSPPMS